MGVGCGFGWGGSLFAKYWVALLLQDFLVNKVLSDWSRRLAVTAA